MLTCKASIHLGARINKFVRVPLIATEAATGRPQASRYGLFYGAYFAVVVLNK